jgi:hypothetical protein
VWSTWTFEPVTTLLGCTEKIYQLAVLDQRLYAASKDKAVRVWRCWN